MSASPFIVSLLIAFLQPQVETTTGVLPIHSKPSRSGYLGLGIGIELPIIGPIGGVGSKSRVGTGYTLGGALSFELTPFISLRAFGIWSATKNGRAPVRFFDGKGRTTRRPGAEWYSMDWGLGATYTLRQPGSAWSPYVGADFSFGMRGYEYFFGRKIETLKSEGRQLAEGVGVGANIRMGLRVDLASWLSGLLEITLVYARVGKYPVTSTLAGPKVTNSRENVWLMRLTYAIRLGI